MEIGDVVVCMVSGVKGVITKIYTLTASAMQIMVRTDDGRRYHAPYTPFGVLFFGSEELMTWETLCEEWGYRFKAYRRPPEGEEET